MHARQTAPDVWYFALRKDMVGAMRRLIYSSHPIAFQAAKVGMTIPDAEILPPVRIMSVFAGLRLRQAG